MPGIADLFRQPVRVVNIGLASLAEALRAAGVPVVHVDWRPPAGGDEHMASLLAKLASLEDSEGKP